jgi:hypothetical protein
LYHCVRLFSPEDNTPNRPPALHEQRDGDPNDGDRPAVAKEPQHVHTMRSFAEREQNKRVLRKARLGVNACGDDELEKVETKEDELREKVCVKASGEGESLEDLGRDTREIGEGRVDIEMEGRIAGRSERHAVSEIDIQLALDRQHQLTLGDRCRP